MSIFWLINIWIEIDFWRSRDMKLVSNIHMTWLYLFTRVVSCGIGFCNRFLVSRAWILIPILPCFVTTNFFEIFPRLDMGVAQSPHGSILHQNRPQQSNQWVKKHYFWYPSCHISKQFLVSKFFHGQKRAWPWHPNGVITRHGSK